MNKKTNIMIACCAAAVIVIAGVVWYLSANQNQTETPSNAKSVSTAMDAADAVSAPNAENPDAEPTKAPDKKPDAATEKPAQTKAPEKVKPTFMYFVTNADLENADTKQVLADLQAEYKDRVVFDIKNIDEDPTILESFALVNGQTPALIMLNTTNDICQFLFKSNDKAQLKAAIDGALKG